MACDIVFDYLHTNMCDGASGVAEFYFFPTRNSDGEKNVEVTFDADGTVDTVTPAAGLTVGKLLVSPESSTFTDTAEGEAVNRSISRNQSATIVLHQTSDLLVADIDQMTKGRYTFIVKDNRGLWHLLFMDNGGKVLDTFDPGTAMGDVYANTLNVTGREVRKAPILDQSQVDSIVGN